MLSATPSTSARRPLCVAALLLCASMAGCMNLAPDYRTPPAPVPATWNPTGATAAEPLTAQDWTSAVNDPVLRDVIALALENNRDLKVATLTLAKARTTYQIQEAAQWPTVNVTGTHTESRTPGQATTSGQTTRSRQNTLQVGVTAYELDFFGRVANLKDAALQSYLSSQEAQRSVHLSLVTSVASAWLTLQADMALLDLAQQTLQSQTQTYERMVQSQQLGSATALAVAQALASKESAQLSVSTTTAQLQQDRNALELLLGCPLPEGLSPRTATAAQNSAWALPPAGLSSDVLLQRPDVRSAEHLLQAANANVGAARAALYPRVSLTAAAGTASNSLNQLFQGGAWSFAPSVSWPLLDGGAGRAGVESAQLSYQIQWATYDKTVQTAFKEVADALAVRQSLQERLTAQQSLVSAYQQALTLSQARYTQGADSYLTVLDAQRSLFAAQQALINLQLLDQSNRMTLYKVLGGAWPAAQG